MAGDCDLMSFKKLKCALEFSFIGLCKNIFGCSKARITVHGKIVLKSNSEEMCTLNFDDTITSGECDTSVNNIHFDALPTYCKTSDLFMRFSNEKSNIPELRDKFDKEARDIPVVILKNTEISGEQTFSSDQRLFNPSKDIALTERVQPQDMGKVSVLGKMPELPERLTRSVATKFQDERNSEVTKKKVNEPGKYRSPDRIRCCACKHSDVEDGSWDDDKTSVVVDDDDDIPENFESGKLCLESLEDDIHDDTLSPGKTMTNMNHYTSLLSKLKSHADQSRDRMEDGTSIPLNQKPPPQECKKGYSPPLPKKMPNIQIINSLWKKNSRYRHVCLVCGMAFTFRTNLTRHTKKIHGCKPDKLYVDDVQEKALQNNNS